MENFNKKLSAAGQELVRVLRESGESTPAFEKAFEKQEELLKQIYSQFAAAANKPTLVIKKQDTIEELSITLKQEGTRKLVLTPDVKSGQWRLEYMSEEDLTQISVGQKFPEGFAPNMIYKGFDGNKFALQLEMKGEVGEPDKPITASLVDDFVKRLNAKSSAQ